MGGSPANAGIDLNLTSFERLSEQIQGSPANAGIDLFMRSCSRRTHFSGRFPRKRGDRPTWIALSGRHAFVGSPANAGIDLKEECSCQSLYRFPRKRGDRPMERVVCWWLMLVPPQTRG